MQHLHSIQKQFSKNILSRKKINIKGYLNIDKKWTPEKRINVYKNAYLIRAHECLEDDFEFVQFHLGKSNFKNAAIDYALSGPSHSHTLSEFGEHFASFLNKTSHTKELPFLSDLAHLEWLYVLSYNNSELTGEYKKSSINTNLSQMMIHPSVSIFKSHWDFNNLKKIKKTKSKLSYIVYTNKNRTYHEQLSKNEVKLFTELKNNSNIECFVNSITKKGGFSPETISVFFQNWTYKNVIYAV